MESKDVRSTFFLRVKHFDNMSVLKTHHVYFRLSELNNKKRTHELLYSHHSLPQDLNIVTYNGPHNCVIFTVRFKHQNSRAVLGEIVFTFDLIPFNKNIKFEHTFALNETHGEICRNAKKRPRITIQIEDIQNRPFSLMSTLRNTLPFTSPVTTIDGKLINEKRIKDNFMKICDYYSQNKEIIFKKKHKGNALSNTAPDIPMPTGSPALTGGAKGNLRQTQALKTAASSELLLPQNICSFKEMFEMEESGIEKGNDEMEKIVDRVEQKVVFEGLGLEKVLLMPTPYDYDNKLRYYFDYEY